MFAIGACRALSRSPQAAYSGGEIKDGDLIGPTRVANAAMLNQYCIRRWDAWGHELPVDEGVAMFALCDTIDQMGAES